MEAKTMEFNNHTDITMTERIALIEKLTKKLDTVDCEICRINLNQLKVDIVSNMI